MRIDDLNENLRKWFKEKWVRFGPDGKIRGSCARGDDSEGKPKCLPQAKAHALGKKGRKYAASKKRREDPNPERRGPAKNVATKKKTDEAQLDELKCWPGYTRVRGVPAGAPGSCKKKTNEAGDAFMKGIENTPEYKQGFATGKLPVPYPEGSQQYVNYYKGVLDKASPFLNKRKMSEEQVEEKWSQKYKDSINCSNPKGFSQKAHCAGKKKDESMYENKCPHCGGEMVSEELMNEKKDACYYKVKSRYKVWPSAYASGALVKCRKKGAKNWGNKSESVEEGEKLQGTPVVSLKDFDDKDTKKDKYGRTVPKKLKKDDPRVKFHKDEKQGVAEGGFFDPDQPNPGDLVRHKYNKAVGKVKSIATQGNETWVYFKDNTTGEMNYGQWKKHVFPVKTKGVAEGEQKTVAKTWDQMTPKEKLSGVKGRTVWNEKTRKYYTVFDVPADTKPDPNIKQDVKVNEFVQGYNMGQAGVRKYKPKHVPNQDEIQKMSGIMEGIVIRRK